MNADANGRSKSGEPAKDADTPDVLLDVPNLKVEELQLELDDLRAHISLRTELAGFVKVDVGVDAYLNHVKLGVKGVDAQAMLTVRLERILDTFNKALATMDSNPELVLELIRRTSDIAEELFGETRDDVTETSEKNEQALPISSPENITSGAKRKSEENGVDVSQIKGTGKDGRILIRDVERSSVH